MKLPVPLSFDWDDGNIDKNWDKHKIHFKDAEEVFFNKPLKIYIDKVHSTANEVRYISFGKTNESILLTIVFTIRNRQIRIISARKQHPKERKAYEKK